MMLGLCLFLLDSHVSLKYLFLASCFSVVTYHRNATAFHQELLEPNHAYMFVFMEMIQCIGTHAVVVIFDKFMEVRIKASMDIEALNSASLRILNALCDVVVQVDEQLRIQSPQPQLLHLLHPKSGTSLVDLRMQSLGQYVATVDEFQKLKRLVRQSTDSTVTSPAAAINIQLRRVDGEVVNTSVFHTEIKGSTICKTYALGIIENLSDSSQDRNPFPDVASTVASNTLSIPRLLQEQLVCGSSTEADGISADVSFQLDAGSPRLELLGCSPALLGASIAHGEPQLLDLLTADASRDLDQWAYKNRCKMQQVMCGCPNLS